MSEAGVPVSRLRVLGDGPPLVLIHGFPLDHRLWMDQQPLAGSRSLLILDLPGFGLGPDPSPEMQMTDYARSVLAALDEAGVQRAAFCGLSMGGYVLFELWRQAPDRIQAICLCDTRPEPDDESGKESRNQALELIARGEKDRFLQGFIPRLLSPENLGDASLIARLQEMGNGVSDSGIRSALIALRDRPDSRPDLATIKVPTLIVVGRDDRITPPATARLMQGAIPGSVLREVPRAGHLPPMEQPAAFNRILEEFLEPLSEV